MEELLGILVFRYYRASISLRVGRWVLCSNSNQSSRLKYYKESKALASTGVIFRPWVATKNFHSVNLDEDPTQVSIRRTFSVAVR